MIETTGWKENRLGRRRESDHLIELAALLDPADRELMYSVFERGVPISALARAAAVDARQIHARLRRLLDRMRSPEFQFVWHEAAHWPRERRDIARAIFLRGWTQRDTARAFGRSLHEVRRTVEHVRFLALERPASRA